MGVYRNGADKERRAESVEDKGARGQADGRGNGGWKRGMSIGAAPQRWEGEQAAELSRDG